MAEFTGQKIIPGTEFFGRPHYTQEYLRWQDERIGGLDLLPRAKGIRNKDNTGTWYQGKLYRDDGSTGYGQRFLEKGNQPGSGQAGPDTGRAETPITDFASLFASLIPLFAPKPQQPQIIQAGPSEADLKAERREEALKAETARRTRLLNALASRGSRSTIRYGLG